MKHRIKEFREMLKLSQLKFGEVVNITQQAVHKYESGETEPTLASIDKIAKAFDINPAWLMGWSENIKPNNKPKRVCYVADGPSRIPTYFEPDETGRVIRWKQTKRPRI